MSRYENSLGKQNRLPDAYRQFLQVLERLDDKEKYILFTLLLPKPPTYEIIAKTLKTDKCAIEKKVLKLVKYLRKIQNDA